MSHENDKKKALQAYKDKLITEIYYYDKRISESRSTVKISPSVENFESSDSDSDIFPAPLANDLPITALRSQQKMLKTNLMATQELSNLEVLQSEVNVLVEPPVVEGESPITDTGVWKEVAAECCVGQVPFCITFYAHVSEQESASISYRGLKVTPVKSKHEAELSKSILPILRRPSDAIEVLKSYSVAHRSRRSTLARLADKFGEALFMESVATGGFLLKCANVLEFFWKLENKWNPIAQFHHRFKFEMEYIDKPYLEAIYQAHRQLSDPAVDTDERTLLLAKIIATCLKAASEQLDSSDQEPQPNRRTTLDIQLELPDLNRRKDSEVMAPPTSLPKKSKASNKIESKTTKRPTQDDISNATVKKSKSNDNVQDKPTSETAKPVTTVTKNPKYGAASDNNKPAETKQVDKGEKSVTQSKSGNTVAVASVVVNNNVIADNMNKKDNADANKKSNVRKVVTTKPGTNKKPAYTESDSKSEKTKRTHEKENVMDNKSDNAKKTGTNSSNIKRRSMTNLESANKNTEDDRKSAPITNTKVVNNKNTGKKQNSVNKKPPLPKLKDAQASDGKVKKNVANIINENGDVAKKVVKKLAKPKVAEKTSSAANPQKANSAPKNTANIKAVSSVAGKKITTNTEKVTKPLNEEINKVNKTNNQNNKKIPQSVTNTRSVPGGSGIVKKMSANIGKENTNQINTKIPQKKFGTPKKTIVKKAPIRISPKKPLPKTKTPLAGVNIKKIVQKTVTGIPRLMPKTTKKT